MTDVNKIVYDLLDSLDVDGLKISQGRPERIEHFPSITFVVFRDVPKITIDKELQFQEVEVGIDIWTNTSVEGSALLSTLESALREEDILMSSCVRIPDPDRISHIATVFKFIV